MLARLHVIIASENELEINRIKELLLTINPNFSISPARSYPGIKDHSELYCTFNIDIDDVKVLLDKLNNDWDGEIDDCVCYGFNTVMFDELIYCLEFILFD